MDAFIHSDFRCLVNTVAKSFSINRRLYSFLPSLHILTQNMFIFPNIMKNKVPTFASLYILLFVEND